MRTVVETKTVYKYDELSERAKSKALDRFNEGLDASEEINEIIKGELEDAGLSSLDVIEFSLGYCQGDGVAFYGKLDLEELSKKNPEVKEILSKLGEKKIEVWGEVIRNSSGYHYTHWNTMNVSLETTPYDYDAPESKTIDNLILDLERTIKAHVKSVSQECENLGYAEVELQKSEESFKRFCQAYSLEFYEDGEEYEGE